jgi:hypothetical protein
LLGTERVRPPLALVRSAYRRLPEGIRYGLRPLNALDEACSHLPPRGRVAAERLLRGARSLRAALASRGRLVRLSGASAVHGAPLHALVDLGREGEAFWGGLLFAGRPTRTVVGETRTRFGILRAGAGRLDADIVLLRHHRLARGAAEAAGFIAVPTWLDTTIDTPGSVEEHLARIRSGRRTIRSDLRRLQREGLEASVGGGEDVGAFLREMHQPFARARWGASYVPLPRAWMRQAPRFCRVLWIVRRGARVGGALLEPRGRVLRDVAVGVRDPDDPYSVRAAQYYFALRYAIAAGHRRLDLGGCRPVLSDGVLRTKLKWGARLVTTLQWDYLALAFPRGPEALRGLLAAHPLVAEVRGRLWAVAHPTAAPAAVPGLAGTIVPDAAGWTTRAAATAATAAPATAG